jgi:hypothetical protein
MSDINWPALLAALDAGGWKLVPKVPTEDMIGAWRQDQAQGRSLQSSYRAMLAAASPLISDDS